MKSISQNKIFGILRILSVIGVICLSPKASLAIVGDYLQINSLPEYVVENVCVIVKDGEEICSGTRISKNEVISAAHCGKAFGEFHEPIFGVRCGSDSKSTRAWFNGHSSFRMNKAAYTTRAGIDISKLNGNFSSEKTASFIEIFSFDEIGSISELECIVGGYGYNNDGIRGDLNFTAIENMYFDEIVMGARQIPLNFSSTIPGPMIQIVRVSPNPAKNTDSGGPILCLQGEKFKLFAVTSGSFMGFVPLLDRYFETFDDKKPANRKNFNILLVK